LFNTFLYDIILTAKVAEKRGYTMTAYELMIKTNHHLIQGGKLTEPQKANIVRQLLASRVDERKRPKFFDDAIYPKFFIPPYNEGRKFQTVIPMSPKTHILSANAYELEIIRLLYIFDPDNSEVREILIKTLARLKVTCPGGECCIGECFHSSLPVLRLLAAIPNETEWIKNLMLKIQKHIDDKKKCNNGAVSYYWLCLSELPIEIAAPEILRYKDKMVQGLNKNDPLMICVIRNALNRI